MKKNKTLIVKIILVIALLFGIIFCKSKDSLSVSTNGKADSTIFSIVENIYNERNS